MTNSFNRRVPRGLWGWFLRERWHRGDLCFFSADSVCVFERGERGFRGMCMHAEWVRLGKISSKAFLTRRASLSACMDDYMTAPHKNEWIKMPAKHPPSPLSAFCARFSNARRERINFQPPPARLLNGMPTAKICFSPPDGAFFSSWFN